MTESVSALDFMTIWGKPPKYRARKLSTIMRAINDVGRGYKATLEPSWSSTDTKVAGTRARRIGAGRRGNKLVVYLDGAMVFEHDSSRTYTHNGDVEAWVAEHIPEAIHPKIRENSNDG